jgi:hypothetical protein
MSVVSAEAKRRRAPWFVWVATAVWLGAFGLGTAAFLRFEFTPGDDARAPSIWPKESSLALGREGATLVLFAHPHCVCTRASLDELQVVLSHQTRPVTVHAVFVQLPGFTDEDMADESWEKAGRIPGLERRIDVGGVEARRFSAVVSGFTVLYDASGELLFEGGITGSRGQVGANAGRNAVIDLLHHGSADVHRTHVFGCALFDRAERIRPPVHETSGA